MKKKILVVDDQAELLELTQRLLHSRGYDVVTLTEGKNAIEVIKKELPNLVIMDMLLPDRDGDQICREIKSDHSIRHIPVLLTTGQMLEQSEYVLAGVTGPDDYLMKPFEIDDLLSKIEKLLAK